MKIIHELRARCKECNLDKMIVFYRVPNGIPSQMYKAHEQDFKERIFPEKYGCHHKPVFNRKRIQDYMWDEKANMAVKV